MSNQPQRTTSNYRLSRQGFEPLPDGNNNADMNYGDATTDIPLEKVRSNNTTRLPRDDSITPLTSAPTNMTSATSKERRRMFGGRRVKKTNSKGEPNGKVGYDGEEDTLNRMGQLYQRVLEFSIITRYFVYVAPVALCIAVPIIVGATAAHSAKIGGVRIVWFFTWVEIVWLSLWISKTVAHFLPAVFQLLAGVVSSGTRKYALVLKALEIPLSLVGWAVTSLATFVPVMTRNPDNSSETPNTTKDWESIVQRILAACVVAALALLTEKTFIQLISINYHRKQFNAKIRDSKRSVYLIGLLYEASRTLFPMYCNEFAEEDYTIADQLDLSRALGSGNASHRRSGSATPMRLLQDVGRFGDKVTSAFGNMAHEITGKQVFNPNSAHSIVVEALEKKRTAEALARRIWMSFVVEGKEALFEEDIVDVLGDQHQEEADEAFAALDRDGNGDISLDEMILAVTEISRERKSIATSMHDVDQAINVLDRMLITVVSILVVFVFVAFLNKSFVTTLATTGTALLSLSFVFSVTCQEVLGSCIFLFVKHPFDIGDRVDIGSDQLIVDHISLLFTVFRRVSGANVGRLVQIPNIVLNTLWIENISRSKAMKEQVSIMISFDTSFEDVQLLKHELLTFVTDKENSRDFQSDLEVEVLGTSDMSKLELRVEIRHKSNWSNESIRAARRSKFMCALVQALRRVPIYGPGGGGDPLGSAANATYSVTIPSQVAENNKDAAAVAKEGKRLVPTKKADTEEAKATSPVRSSPFDNQPVLGLSVAQDRAIDDLNARSPASDPTRDDIWTSSREDSSTLGERPSIDRQDLEDVRGLMRRESTKGKRRPGLEARNFSPNVPTIAEPQSQIARMDYAMQANAGLDTQQSSQPANLNTPLPSSPHGFAAVPSQTAPYGAPIPRPQQGQAQGLERRQVSRSDSNPYRQRSESLSRKPLSPGGRVAPGYQNGPVRPYEEV